MEVYREFSGVRLFNLWGKGESPFWEQVLDLWKRNKALPTDADPKERVREIVLVAVDPEDRVVGVNTVFPGVLPPEAGAMSPVCYYYRLFIEPTGRKPHLMMTMTDAAFDVLQEHTRPDGCDTFAFLSDNQGLVRPGMTRLLKRHGYVPTLRYSVGKVLFLRPF